jgi:hypothetical protein
MNVDLTSIWMNNKDAQGEVHKQQGSVSACACLICVPLCFRTRRALPVHPSNSVRAVRAHF